ncbi:DUF305 domain-containing protein [Nocardia uniformis]|uniref:DUF305 domain-containing protein n=1 Tax=Nocardia uniformis TaxID=53432 RepID=A0A849C3I6_9NOCA|nr:DUF305 domain-containing protein [Nocardia uniformis]NNH70347.1 DUF305 domain-containing protein [Nocardia uniformis]
MPPLVPGDDADDSGSEHPAAENPAAAAPARPSQRTALLILGVIGVLLIGFALGVFVRIPLDGRSDPAPSAVDIGFSQDMSVHHTQAVEMSAVALSNSTDPAVKGLAYDILTTQQNQAGRMQAWLQLWDEPLLPSGGYMGWITGTEGSSHHGGGQNEQHTGPVPAMPGMATQAELNKLREATGPALDVMFLQLMLRHHQGGMAMIEFAADRAETNGVRALAASMVKTQQGEAELIAQMLTDRGASALPMN